MNAGGSRPARLAAALAVVALVTVGCGGGPILANPPIVLPTPPAPGPVATHPPDPVAISFPRDDGPHDRLTEWWYYTGHLRAADGRRFGFEAVVFRAERGAVPTAWASHLALTDEGGSRFYYAQRSEVGSQADRSARDAAGAPAGFDLNVSGLNPALVAAGAPALAAPWRLSGANGADRIEATLTPEEAAAAGASFGLALDLHTTKAPALHDGDGFVDFGLAGSSYYYSRTRMDASGELQLNGERLRVTGIAWFDHQWGDFVSVGGGGWDWFAVNLDDGTDVTVSIVRDEFANPFFVYGTLVRPSGEVVRLGEADGLGAVDSFGSWTSPLSGRVYPLSRELVAGDLLLSLKSTVADQELDTRPTTGVIYWEGSQTVDVAHIDRETGEVTPTSGSGRAYVEITRYDAPRP